MFIVFRNIGELHVEKEKGDIIYNLGEPIGAVQILWQSEFFEILKCPILFTD